LLEHHPCLPLKGWSLLPSLYDSDEGTLDVTEGTSCGVACFYLLLLFSAHCI